ncbi:MAG: hypothetical protein Q9174_002199, partial [Haloplaca sp. 1 TL-2023]
PRVDNDNAQRWLISDVSKNEKMIINNGTGAVLTALKAWLLEYLTCEFAEADQKSLRGAIVEDCDKFRFSNTVTQGARECYDVMQEDIEPYGVFSYVYTSIDNPGSSDDGVPDVWGDCTGYQARSYRYFKGDSKGSGVGGDLRLPYK